MNTTVDQISRAMTGGSCLVCACTPDPADLVRLLAATDPVPSAAGRPVFCWDRAGGLVGTGEWAVAGSVDGAEGPAQAVRYASRFGGPALFLFNMDGVDVGADEAALVRPLRRIVERWPGGERALVLVSKAPLPAIVAGLGDQVGYDRSGQTVAAAIAAAPSSAAAAAPRPGGDTRGPAAPAAPAIPPPPPLSWRDIRTLDTFASDAWRRRLERLTEKDVQEIVRGGYHEAAVQRVNDLRDGRKGQFTRRDAIIDLMTYATVAQVPVILLGPPGTAKSLLVRSFCQGLGLSAVWDAGEGDDDATAGELGQGGRPAEGRLYGYAGSSAGGAGAGRGTGNGDSNGHGRTGLFEYLLARYTTPEEIFGPIDINALINHRSYHRVTAGKLPQAEVAFLDEIFKASSAIINTLLTILNERLFHNDGRAWRVPLVMVFAASNEPPQDAQLAAVYDRFPLRVNCGRVDDDGVADLWQRSWELGYDRQFGPPAGAAAGGGNGGPVACTNDFRLLHRVALCRYGGRSLAAAPGGRFDFNAEFLRVFKSLRRDYDVSDRTLRALYLLARSMAVVEGRDHLSVDELNVFRYVSWDETGGGELDRLVSNLKRGVSL